MPTDSSIYFQQQSPDIVGSIEKGLKMSEMIRNNQIQRQEQQKQLDIKNAYSAGTVQNPDGSISFDKNKTLAAIGQLAKSPESTVSGQDLNTITNQFASQEAAQAKAKTEKMQADSAYAFQNLNVEKVKDQDSWIAAKQQAIKDGHPEAAQLPDQYDPKIQAQLLDHAKRVALGPQNYTEDTRKQQANDTSVQSNLLKAQELKQQRQTGELDKIHAMLENTRQSPAVAQAEKDIYAVKKVDSLVNLYGDPDKLNPTQVQLLATEVAKIASGGVPSIHELQGLNPSTISTKFAELAQKVTSKPSPANVGEFVKAMQEYTTSLKKDAQDTIKDKYGRVMNPVRGLYKDHPVFKGLEESYTNRFSDGADSSKPSWAK